MIPPAPWTAALDRGLAHLRASEFDDALTALDEAVRLGGSLLVFFASREEVLGRLWDLDDAFNLASSREDALTGPERTRADDARLFARLAALPERARMLILSSALADASADLAFKDQIACVQGQASHLRRTRNLIDYLPAEMLIEIGRYVVLSSEVPASDLALDLIGVSQRWRAIFSRDKHLWGRLKLDCSGTQADLATIRRGTEKAISLLRKGLTRVVWIEGDVAEDVRSVLALLEGTLSGAREVKVRLPLELDLKDVWSMLRGSTPLLRRLSISWPVDLPDQARHLSLPHSQVALTSLSLEKFKFVNLTSVGPLLRYFPHLKHLKMQDCENLVLTESQGQLSLPDLRTLRLGNLTDRLAIWGGFSLIAPLIQSLTISQDSLHNHASLLFPEHCAPNTANLRTLFLRHSLRVTLTASQLRQMPALTSLSLAPRSQPIEEVMYALTAREGEETACPLLERLDVSRGFAPVVGESGPSEAGTAAIKMVRSRSTGTSGSTKLTELTMDDRLMERETHEWLEANVEKFQNRDIAFAPWRR